MNDVIVQDYIFEMYFFQFLFDCVWWSIVKLPIKLKTLQIMTSFQTSTRFYERNKFFLSSYYRKCRYRRKCPISRPPSVSINLIYEQTGFICPYYPLKCFFCQRSDLPPLLTKFIRLKGFIIVSTFYKVSMECSRI